MEIERKILLNPGPATTTDTVKLAQVVPDICPREAEFTELMASLRRDLLRIVHAKDDYTAVLFCGSGTINLDVAINSLVSAKGKILFVNNGAYTRRGVEIAKAYNLPFVELRYPENELPNLAEVKAALAADPLLEMVYTTHNETGTGILNPIRQIGELAHAYGAKFVVDTTSTYAMLPIDVYKDNVDFCMASAQKGLMAMTGLSFIIGKKAIIEESQDYPKRSYYCNLYQQYANFEKNGEMQFTPPVQTIYAAVQGIKEYFQEGEAAKYLRHLDTFVTLRDGMARLGFKELIKREWQAGLVLAVEYPQDPHWDFAKIHDYLYERGITIYPGKVSDIPSFRLCSLGAITPKDAEYFLEVLQTALEHYQIKIPVE